jgi:hypothetical protein
MKSPQNKWDTVSLNLPPNPLKTKKSEPHKVGHFYGVVESEFFEQDSNS